MNISWQALSLTSIYATKGVLRIKINPVYKSSNLLKVNRPQCSKRGETVILLFTTALCSSGENLFRTTQRGLPNFFSKTTFFFFHSSTFVCSQSSQSRSTLLPPPFLLLFISKTKSQNNLI